MRRVPLMLALTCALPGALHALPQERLEPLSALPEARALPSPPTAAAHELTRLDGLLARGHADVLRLCRAAHLAIELGVAAGDAGDEAERLEWVRRGEAYARRALAEEPSGLEARYLVGAAMGLRAAHEPVGERVRIAAEIRDHAEAILARDPGHAGALHLKGQLHAAAMRLNPLVRFFARRVFGGEALEGASWAAAEAAFRGALEREPDEPAHRIELARVLLETGRAAEARAELLAVLESAGDDPLARHFRARAVAILTAIE